MFWIISWSLPCIGLFTFTDFSQISKTFVRPPADHLRNQGSLPATRKTIVRFVEIALVLVDLDHVANFIVCLLEAPARALLGRSNTSVAQTNNETPTNTKPAYKLPVL